MDTMITMITSTAEVLTDRPGRYGKQLVSHLSRRSPGSWDDGSETGTIRFEGGTAGLTATNGVLRLDLVTSIDLLDRLEDVLGRHLVRFATRGRLDVRWQRSDGSDGSVQSSAAEPSEGGAEHGRDR